MLPDVAETATVKETVWPVTPALTPPIFHVTSPEDKAPPPVVETKLVPEGKASLITTPVAFPDPVLP